MKSGHRVNPEVVQSVVTAWSMLLQSSEQSRDPVLLKKCILFLRFACVQGSSTQTAILTNDSTITNIRTSIFHLDEAVSRSTWQLCSNLLVQCPENVEVAVRELLPLCLTSLDTATREMDTIAAVLHNLLEANKLLVPPIELDKSEIYRVALGVIYKHPEEQFTYLQFLLEDLILHEPEPSSAYLALQTADRIKLHQYATEYVKSGENELSSALLRILSDNFNRLSDGILTWLTGQRDGADPQELLSLLECLCTITGHQKYSLAFKSEASMFINSGGECNLCSSIYPNNCHALLALLVACCESQKSEVAPKAKLTDFEASQEETDEDPFYDFKTLLIRLIGNLAYKNKKNQDYVSFSSIYKSQFN